MSSKNIIISKPYINNYISGCVIEELCFKLTLVLVELQTVDSSLLGHDVTEDFYWFSLIYKMLDFQDQIFLKAKGGSSTHLRLTCNMANIERCNNSDRLINKTSLLVYSTYDQAINEPE